MPAAVRRSRGRTSPRTCRGSPSGWMAAAAQRATEVLVRYQARPHDTAMTEESRPAPSSPRASARASCMSDLRNAQSRGDAPVSALRDDSPPMPPRRPRPCGHERSPAGREPRCGSARRTGCRGRSYMRSSPRAPAAHRGARDMPPRARNMGPAASLAIARHFGPIPASCRLERPRPSARGWQRRGSHGEAVVRSPTLSLPRGRWAAERSHAPRPPLPCKRS